MKGSHKILSVLTVGASEPHSDNEATSLACSIPELHKIWSKRVHVRESVRWYWACLTEDRFSTRFVFLLFSTQIPRPFPVGLMFCVPLGLLSGNFAVVGPVTRQLFS